MFTGIVQTLGRVTRSLPLAAGVRLEIACAPDFLSDVRPGDSVAVDGVCLTAVALGADHFHADVSAETLGCTTGFAAGGEVNLEKALRLSDRLGGHLVSGHVDGVGAVTRFEARGESYHLEIEAPPALARYLSAKGSVTVNGVSLTVNGVDGARFHVNLIPHTLSATTLKNLRPGSPVNLEADLLARYVERLLPPRPAV